MAHECKHQQGIAATAPNETIADGLAFYAMLNLRSHGFFFGKSLCEQMASDPNSPCKTTDECIKTSLKVEEDFRTGE